MIAQSIRRLWAATVSAALLAGFATPALADWRRAESERFIVYSEAGEAPLRAFVQKLETFDRLLRLNMGLPLDEAPPRKLPIYLVETRSGLRVVAPGMSDAIAGFYTAGDEDIFAVAARGDDDDTLLHEYAHHFMMQNFAYPYPSWFVEGFAEYYMTADIEPDGITVGRYNENRAYWLRAAGWPATRELLAKRPGEVTRRQENYYPLAWLLTHWFFSDEGRRAQLNAYLLDVGAGADPADAMYKATGLQNADLRRTLRAYMNGRMPYHRLTHPFPAVAVTVTVLPDSADDLLLLGQRLKRGVAEDRRAATVAEVRRGFNRHPDDPFAQLVMGHAELQYGDAAVGEAILTALLAREPQNVEALQLLAKARLGKADETEDAAEALRLRREARGFLNRAFAADDANYITFQLLGRSRQGEAGYPTENDLVTWELAFELAPQVSDARLGYASALLLVDRKAEAITVLEPLANSPHGGEAADRATAMIHTARGVNEEQAAAEEAERQRRAAEEEGD